MIDQVNHYELENHKSSGFFFFNSSFFSGDKFTKLETGRY